MATSVQPTPSPTAAPAVERNFSATIAKVSQQTGIPADPVAPKESVQIVNGNAPPETIAPGTPIEALLTPTDKVPPPTVAEPSAALEAQPAATPLADGEPTSELSLDDGTVILRAERNPDGTYKTKFDPNAKLEFEIVLDKKTGEKKSYSKTLPELTRLAKDGITLQQKVQVIQPEVDYYRKNVDTWAKAQAETTTKLTALEQQYADMEALNRELLSAPDDVVIGHRERYASEMSPEKVARREADALRAEMERTRQTTQSLQAQSFIQARLAPALAEANAVLGEDTVAGIITRTFSGPIPPHEWNKVEQFVNGPLKERVAQEKGKQEQARAAEVAREATLRQTQANAQRAVNDAGRSTVPVGSASPDRAPTAPPAKNMREAMNKLINRPIPQSVAMT